MFQIRSHSTSMFSSAANRSAASLAICNMRASEPASRCRWSSSCSAVSTTDVTIPGLRDDAARRADRAVPDLGRDLADVERELRGAGERVAALVHRRRAGVRRLAAPGEARALDPERPEHDAERDVHRLEHRALLDVELEVRGGVRRAARAPRAHCRARRRARATRPAAPCRPGRPAARSSSWSRIEPAAADEPKSERPKRAPSSSAQDDEPHGDGRLALRRRSAAAPRRRRERSGSRRASRRSAPSPGARRAAAPGRTRPAA